MKNNPLLIQIKSITILIMLFSSPFLLAQQQTNNNKKQNEFWDKVQFGGGVGLGIGSGYTDISLSPSAIYNFNNYVALGLGVQYAYAKQKTDFASHLYGGSIIGLFTPFEEAQLSAELEQLRVNVDFGPYSGSEDYWNTGLFLGAGFRTGNVTVGVRYNVLHNKNKSAYSEAFMPFARVFF